MFQYMCWRWSRIQLGIEPLTHRRSTTNLPADPPAGWKVRPPPPPSLGQRLPFCLPGPPQCKYHIIFLFSKVSVGPMLFPLTSTVDNQFPKGPAKPISTETLGFVHLLPYPLRLYFGLDFFNICIVFTMTFPSIKYSKVFHSVPKATTSLPSRSPVESKPLFFLAEAGRGWSGFYDFRKNHKSKRKKKKNNSKKTIRIE